MPIPVRIAPSILAADFAKLGEEVRAVAAAGADLIHLDVMDGHFVPNLTIGAAIVAALRPHTTLPFDVHLMLKPVLSFIAPFADAGADIVTVHAELGEEAHRAVAEIRRRGKQAGIALNPDTPAQTALEFLDEVDLILVMTVQPGFGGQSYRHEVTDKIAQIREAIDRSGRPVSLEVDGGITVATAREAIAAGADILVAGSATFQGGAAHYRDNIRQMRSAA